MLRRLFPGVIQPVMLPDLLDIKWLVDADSATSYGDLTRRYAESTSKTVLGRRKEAQWSSNEKGGSGEAPRLFACVPDFAKYHCAVGLRGTGSPPRTVQSCHGRSSEGHRSRVSA